MKNKFIFIAGPCVIEDENTAFKTAKELKRISEKFNVDFFYKSSFDKANRSSIESYRGPGIKEGLRILKNIKDKLNVKICTDVHETNQINDVSKVADIIQIPAFLCRQTDLLVGAAKTGKIVNIKKGQFMSGKDMLNSVDKVKRFNPNIIITERGNCFGYNKLVVDFTNIIEMKKFGFPVVFDATHSVQIPSGNGKTSGGNREYVKFLARASICCDVDGIFMEVHPDPDNAKSDGPNMLKLDEVENVLRELLLIRGAIYGKNY